MIGNLFLCSIYFLPGLYVLLTVMEEKEQCRKDQHCSHC